MDVVLGYGTLGQVSNGQALLLRSLCWNDVRLEWNSTRCQVGLCGGLNYTYIVVLLVVSGRMWWKEYIGIMYNERDDGDWLRIKR